MAQLAIVQWPMKVRVGNQSFDIQVDLGWLKIPNGIGLEEYVRGLQKKNPRQFQRLVEEALAIAVVEQYHQEQKARRAEESSEAIPKLADQKS